MTGVRGLSALAIARDTNIISVKKITESALYAFRLEAFLSDAKRVYPGAEALSLDIYDRFSLHLLYENNRKICGAARIVKTVEGRLPFCTHYFKTNPKAVDFELSRFVTRADRDGKKAFLYLLPMIGHSFFCAHIVENKSTIFADVLTGHPRTLNRTTYLEFGFEPTGQEAFDRDYGLSSELFVLPPERFSTFLNSCRRYMERIGRVRALNDDITDTIQTALLSHNKAEERKFIASQAKLRVHA